MTIRLEIGDCREVVQVIADDSIDSCVTDPPYALVSIQKRFGKPGSAPVKLKVIVGQGGSPYERGARGFMGQQWDTGEVAHDPAFWGEVLRVLKPGAHLVAFGGTRTYHRMVCAIEDAGFDIRDQIGWAFGSGFPKSHDVSKGIDKAAGIWRGRAGAVTTAEQPSKGTEYERTDKGKPATDAARQWEGWGTALKPAWEPICLARKPLSEATVAANVLRWGTGALNIDGCRVEFEDRHGQPAHSAGRWPANLCHDGSDEVIAAFPNAPGQQRYVGPEHGDKPSRGIYGDFGTLSPHEPRGDDGSAARFFYSAKADKTDRWGSKHPTVKPVALMRWLARLVTPPGGTVLDPFAGSGSTGVACLAEGFNCILIEREISYSADIRERLAHYTGDGRHSLVSKTRNAVSRDRPGSLL